MYYSFVQFIKQLPFIRLVIPFIIGISIQIGLSTDLYYYPYFAAFLSAILFLIELIKHDKRRYKYRLISGISVNLLLVVMGAWLLQSNKPDLFKHSGKEIIIEAVLSEPPVEKEKSYKTVARIKTYILNDSVFTLNKKIVLYIEKDSLVKKLHYGDKIIFKSRINEIKTSGNPYEFNYKQFLFRKGIVGQTYIKKENWRQKNTGAGSYIFSLAYKARNSLAKIYKIQNINNQEFAVLQALTLGDKSEIDEDTRQSYVASGAMHILAVSGLHVGIIYVLFSFFFRFFDKLKTKKYSYGKGLKAIILISILWSFALISGMSPSVSRAATMFTFIIIGQAMKSKVNIYNSLAASAFLLLIINPYQITNVGFQLSYAAVFSIVYFQPKIVNIFNIKNKVIYYVWSLTAVSIAAQIGTAPIALYYFHIFPNYFMLTNIIVIPLATLIIYAAAGLLLTSFIPFISVFFSYILKGLIWFLNFSVSNIEKLPYSHVENISFNISDTIFATLLIILIGVFIQYKHAKTLMHTLIVLLIWLSFNTYGKILNNSENKLIVYNIKNKSVINIIGKENILIADSSVFKNETIKYGPLNNWMHLNKTDYKFVDIYESYNSNTIFKQKKYFETGSKKILIINDKTQIKYKSKNKINLDYIIISGNSKINIKDILKLYNVKTIIFDSSIGYYQIEDWKHECDILNQKYYSVIDKGAFYCIL